MRKLRIILFVFVFISSWIGTAFSERPPDESQWFGVFVRDSNQFNSASIEISDVTKHQFHFKIHAFSGGHTGGISGIAYIDNNTAIFDDGNGGTLKFSISDNEIKIEQSQEMYRYGGIGVVFDGQYIYKKLTKTPVENEHYFTDRKVFKGNQEQEFRRIVGDYYLKFKDTGQIFYEEKDLDNSNARVYRIGVRGLFSIMESIIMVRDSDNAIWAAVIDNNKVLYFTNTNDTQYVPITISKWHDRFKDKPIYYIPALLEYR